MERKRDPLSFLKLVEKYNKNLRFDPKDKKLSLELEVKISSNGRSLLSRTDYDNVVKKLKSLGYKCQGDPGGIMLLRMSPEEVNGRTGRIQISNVRAELSGIESIQEYCKTNDLQKLFDENHSVKLVEKSNWVRGDRMDSVINNDFNFKMDLRSEINISTEYGKGLNILEKWKDVKKTFRLINRVTFTQPYSPGNKNPCRVDLSIIKKQYNPSYTIQQCNLFHLPESYEFEIEVRNYIVIQESFQPPEIQRYIKKTIQDVSAGIQNSDFPISNSEQKEVLREYYDIITKDSKEKDYLKMFNTSNFIGPSSVTLHLKHIIEPNENDAGPNIRVDYTVTEKTDGERYLMFISKSQKIYFINSRMNIIFTGCIATDDEFVNSVIDGEYVANDKNMNPIQAFYAFDIYFISGKDSRHMPFYSLEYAEDKVKHQYEFRHSFLSEVFEIMKTKSVVDGEPCSTQFFMKTFYPQNREQTIFDCCYEIKRKEDGGGFIYEIDGLIFTPMRLGVGEEKLDGPIPEKKTTWWWSLKWKPEKYNSIDFLVTTKKGEGGEDLLSPIFQDGKNLETDNQLQFYKTIVLRCGYNEKNHGYLNPCQSLLDDKVPKNTGESDYKPVQFYPTEPSDSNAGIANILTTKDSKGMYVMKTKEDDLVQDNTVVEFYYDKGRPEGWRWIPLRVRYDKTSEYRSTGKKFGNDYSIANDNWHSIHHPITERMIFHGMDIPTSLEVDESVYYNTNMLRNNLQSLRDFHNLYVKKLLISSVSKKGYNLIDYACGKAGDLPKWMYCHLSFVFGIDISKDNLENKKNGCCARYLNEKARHHKILGALFVNGNSAENIKSGEAMMDAKSKLITKAVFGEIQDKGLDSMVHRYFGVGRDGFDISSCQFATHYFFKSKSTLHNFLRNVSECTRIGGHFIGTCYDGRQIFNELRDRDVGGSVSIYDKSNVKIWSIVKKYDEEEFLDDDTSLGYEILVYQESINKLIPEFLVNFEYLKQIMIYYGFSLITKEEANEVGLPDGSDMFKQLYSEMIDKRAGKRMNENERKISFLNRYFVFRKNVNVNAKQVAESFMRNDISEIFASDVKFGAPEREFEILEIESKSNLKEETDPIRVEMEELKESVDEPVSGPVDEPVSGPVDEPVDEPVDQPADDSLNEPVGGPVDEPVSAPVDEPVDEVIKLKKPKAKEPKAKETKAKESKEKETKEKETKAKEPKTKAREKRETGKTRKIKIIDI
jgi:hypothetical protein